MPFINHIYYEEAGVGRPVIFIHCPALSHAYWRPVLNRLRSFCRCIAFDIRGHGRSGLGDQPWTFADVGSDVIELARGLNLEQPVLVGYSSGSCIAFHAYLQEPSLFAGMVGVGAFSECSNFYLQSKTSLGLLAVRLGLSAQVGWSIARTNGVDSEHVRAIMPDALHVRPTALASFLQQTISVNLTPQLDRIQVPTLLVYGDKDEPMHRYYRILAERLPFVRAVVFPRTDHRVPTRHPADFADLLAQFVADLGPERNPPLPYPLLPFLQPGASEHQLH